MAMEQYIKMAWEARDASCSVRAVLQAVVRLCTVSDERVYCLLLSSFFVLLFAERKTHAIGLDD